MADWMSRDEAGVAINDISIENKKQIGDDLIGMSRYTVIINSDEDLHEKQHNYTLNLFPFGLCINRSRQTLRLEISFFKKLQFGFSIGLVE